MRHVKPVAGDLYYLRLLLLHVPGAQAKSWDDLKSSPGESGEPTFRQLALELGLLKDDAHTRARLEEGIRVVKSLPKISELFAETLVWLEVSKVAELWTSAHTARLLIQS